MFICLLIVPVVSPLLLNGSILRSVTRAYRMNEESLQPSRSRFLDLATLYANTDENESVSNHRRKMIMDRNCGLEFALAFIEDRNRQHQASDWTDRLRTLFLRLWPEISSLNAEARKDLLHLLHPLSEIDEFLSFLTHSASYGNSKTKMLFDLQSLLHVWSERIPSPSDKPENWITFLRTRDLLLSQLHFFLEQSKESEVCWCFDWYFLLFFWCFSCRMFHLLQLFTCLCNECSFDVVESA